MLMTRCQQPGKRKTSELPQLLDLLQLSRREWEVRHYCREILMDLRLWQKSYAEPGLGRAVCSFYLKGMILRSIARDCIRLYKLARRKRVSHFQSYMAALPSGYNGKRLAS